MGIRQLYSDLLFGEAKDINCYSRASRAGQANIALERFLSPGELSNGGWEYDKELTARRLASIFEALCGGCQLEPQYTDQVTEMCVGDNEVLQVDFVPGGNHSLTLMDGSGKAGWLSFALVFTPLWDGPGLEWWTAMMLDRASEILLDMGVASYRLLGPPC